MPYRKATRRQDWSKFKGQDKTMLGVLSREIGSKAMASTKS